jgi:alginate O-acetyltransferase complex protein AlgI
VLFRADTLTEAVHYLGAMAGLSSASHQPLDLYRYVGMDVLLAAMVGVVGATPIPRNIVRWLDERLQRMPPRPRSYAAWGRWGAELCILGVVVLACTMKLAAGTYSPFIYFRF